MLLCTKKMLPFKEYRNFSGNLNDKCKYLTDLFGFCTYLQTTYMLAERGKDGKTLHYNCNK